MVECVHESVREREVKVRVHKRRMKAKVGRSTKRK